MLAPAWASADGDARARFAVAQTAYDLGEFEKARVGYAAAYQLDPRPALLFNIAQCHRKLGQWKEAAFFYRRYVGRADPGLETETAMRLITEMDDRAERAAAAKPLRVSARASLVPRPQAGPPPPAPPLVQAEDEPPLHARWWVWAGAGAATALFVTTVVAVGIAAKRDAPGPPPPPGDGKSGKH